MNYRDPSGMGLLGKIVGGIQSIGTAGIEAFNKHVVNPIKKLVNIGVKKFKAKVKKIVTPILVASGRSNEEAEKIFSSKYRRLSKKVGQYTKYIVRRTTQASTAAIGGYVAYTLLIGTLGPVGAGFIAVSGAFAYYNSSETYYQTGNINKTANTAITSFTWNLGLLLLGEGIFQGIGKAIRWLRSSTATIEGEEIVTLYHGSNRWRGSRFSLEESAAGRKIGTESIEGQVSKGFQKPGLNEPGSRPMGPTLTTDANWAVDFALPITNKESFIIITKVPKSFAESIKNIDKLTGKWQYVANTRYQIDVLNKGISEIVDAFTFWGRGCR